MRALNGNFVLYFEKNAFASLASNLFNQFDAIHEILQFLDFGEIAKFSRINKTFNKVGNLFGNLNILIEVRIPFSNFQLLQK